MCFFLNGYGLVECPGLTIFSCLFLLQLIEKQKLIEFAEALRTKLNYFDELENVRFSSYGTYEIHFHVNPTFVEATSLNLKFLAFSPKQRWHDKRPLDILGFHFSKEYKVSLHGL